MSETAEVKKTDSEDEESAVDLNIDIDSSGRVEGTYKDKFNFSTRTFPNFICSEVISDLIKDCNIINNDSSLDATFFLPAAHIEKQEFRCTLERIAAEVFNLHTQGCTYEKESSGAEFWVQVRELEKDNTDVGKNQKKRKREETSGDDIEYELQGESICFHFDKDETIGALANVYISPALSTVTYLSDVGSPTTILGYRYCGETFKITEEMGDCVLSYPKRGNHTCFDGRLLHGVPSVLRDDSQSGTRVSFLVNIWLNHSPIGIEKLPLETCKLLSNIDDNSVFKKDGNNHISPIVRELASECSECLDFPLNEACDQETLQIPLPQDDLHKLKNNETAGNLVSLRFQNGGKVKLV